MTSCFADTFFFLALLNASDACHAKARAANRINRPIIVSAWVLVELADHLCDLKNRHLFAQVLDAIRGDTRFEIVPAENQCPADAMTLYADRPDKEWSLTDCTSFLIMQARGIREALTGDRHFEQAGLVAILK